MLNTVFVATVGAQTVGSVRLSPSAIAAASPAVVTITAKITPPLFQNNSSLSGGGFRQLTRRPNLEILRLRLRVPHIGSHGYWAASTFSIAMPLMPAFSITLPETLTFFSMKSMSLALGFL